MIEFLIEARFNFLDLVAFYFIATELIPWMMKKFEEWLGYAWKCPNCEKGKSFRIRSLDRKTVDVMRRHHMENFHFERLV